MQALWIWGTAVLVYAAFLGWYRNWRAPLGKDEIARQFDRLEARAAAGDRDDMAKLRAFLEADDGREFFMLNLVRLAPEPVCNPATGRPEAASSLLRGYTRTFLPALARRAGHPALVARKVGPYVDSWGIEADPGWSFIGYMRYRSRRDLLELVSDPRFEGAHAFKTAAMPATFNFPTQPRLMTLVGPRIWLGLALALAAALVHIAVLLPG